MTNKEYKKLERIFAEGGLVLGENPVFKAITAREDYTGAPLRSGTVMPVFAFMPCYRDEDCRDVVTTMIRHADGLEVDIESFDIYNSLREWERLSWADCDRIAAEFIVRLNAVADVLSAEYNIKRQPELLTMNAGVLEWCNYEILTDEPYCIDDELTFAQYDKLSENGRIAACGGDKLLAETINLTIEGRHRRQTMAYRSEQLADDLLSMIRFGSGDWRK